MMMKRLRNNVCILMTLAGLASCTSEHMLWNDSQAIRLAVSSQQMTRGTSGQASQNTCFDEGAQLCVNIATSDATTIAGNQIFTASAPSSGVNTLTPPDQSRPPYYPNGDETVTIKAYYPSSVTSSTTAFSVQTNQSTSTNSETTDPYKLSDLMTATLTGQTKTAETVNLQMHHRMARISVSATVTDNLIIKGITLKNVQTSAAYNSSANTWSGTGETGSITVATAAESENLSTLSGVALFPSQTIEGKEFIWVETNRGTAKFVVTSKLFQEGYDYTVALEVGLQNLSMTGAITDWNAATGLATVTKVNKFGMYIEAISGEYTYNGTAQTPTGITVKYKTDTDEKTLVKDIDYTLALYNNTNVGEALVVAEGLLSANGDFRGSAAVQSFVIGQATPSMTFTTTGTVSQEFDWGGTYTNRLSAGSTYDGTMTWSSSDVSVATVDGNGVVTFSKPGTITIRVENDGSGNYSATSAQYMLNITKRSFKNHASIKGFGEYVDTYTGEEKKPVPVVYDDYDESSSTFKQRLFEEQYHFTSAYSNNINAGTNTATITLTGAGTYYDNTTVSKTFSISKVTPVITMTTTAKTIGIGGTYQCDATTTYGTVSYTSSNTSVATVNSTGLVSVRAVGTATITASVAADDNWNAATSKTITITGKEQKEEWTTVGAHTYTCPETAVYTFEVVGGAGGSMNRGRGGKAGFMKASKTLTKGTVIYLYVGAGGQGGYNTMAGGQNGSSDGNGGAGGSYQGGSGGASSEVRIGGTAASYRQLVAGGGGGALSSWGAGKEGGSGSAGNASGTNGEAATASYGAGGGGGYNGGKNGAYGGGYGGSNYIESSWTHISSGVSDNGPSKSSEATTSAVYNGYIKMTYAFE